MSLRLLFLLPLLFALMLSSATELDILLEVKSWLDPDNRFLTSWTPRSDPCGSQAFDGVACNEEGLVANISLQGVGLTGSLPAALGRLRSLTGLYLHFNSLSGEIPKEIASLSGLTDLYLNVNDLSGDIPREMGNMSNLQVLQLCYNKLSGGIPTQLGSLKKASVLALQYNQLTGAIPASLGDIDGLTRLDLSFNRLFGPIPVKVANAPLLEFLDVRNNSLSGIVPTALARLNRGFQYENNPGLCGVGFPDLQSCVAASDQNSYSSEPFKPKGVPTNIKPESSDMQPRNCSGATCPKSSRNTHLGVILGVMGLLVGIIFIGVFSFAWYRRRKQKIGSALDASDSRLSTDQVKEVSRRRRASPLISLEYPNGWDPLASRGQSSGTEFSQEVFESFMLNLEDVKRATQCFSEANLLGKSNFSTVYKGILRDGSVVAIKSIAKMSCKSNEAEFLKGLKLLTLLKHNNLVRLRGFCCSKGRRECFLIFEFVPNGSLLQYLDVSDGNGEVLEWSTRVSILIGVAKGILYLHGHKPAIVHQNISAKKVLVDHWYNPSLSDSGLHKLLTDDIVFSKLKASAAMGYLAPEYITTGRLTEKSDIYAFGVMVLQVITGKSKIPHMTHQAVESGRVEDFVDMNLAGKFSESQAVKLGKLALRCTHECPNHRPSMDDVMQELSSLAKSS